MSNSITKYRVTSNVYTFTTHDFETETEALEHIQEDLDFAKDKPSLSHLEHEISIVTIQEPDSRPEIFKYFLSH